MVDEVKEEVVNEEVSENKTDGKKPKSKVRKAIEWVLTGVFAILFIFFAVGQVKGMIDKEKNFGHTFTYDYGSFVIKTDSMVPEYPVDIAIVTHKDNALDIIHAYEAGETIDITFHDSYLGDAKIPEGKEMLKTRTDATGMVITHRLFDVEIREDVQEGEGRYLFFVAGINKEKAEGIGAYGQYQVLSEKQLLGVVKIKSNFLGGFFGFISTPWGLLVFLLIPAFYLVITSVIDIFKAIKEPDEEGGDNNNPPSGGNNGVGALSELSEEDRRRLKQEMLDEMMKKKGAKK